MITKNFKVNSLANSYAAAIYHDITTRNGGDWFSMKVRATKRLKLPLLTVRKVFECSLIAIC